MYCSLSRYVRLGSAPQLRYLLSICLLFGAISCSESSKARIEAVEKCSYLQGYDNYNAIGKCLVAHYGWSVADAKRVSAGIMYAIADSTGVRQARLDSAIIKRVEESNPLFLMDSMSDSAFSALLSMRDNARLRQSRPLFMSDSTFLRRAGLDRRVRPD